MRDITRTALSAYSVSLVRCLSTIDIVNAPGWLSLRECIPACSGPHGWKAWRHVWSRREVTSYLLPQSAHQVQRYDQDCLCYPSHVAARPAHSSHWNSLGPRCKSAAAQLLQKYCCGTGKFIVQPTDLRKTEQDCLSQIVLLPQCGCAQCVVPCREGPPPTGGAGTQPWRRRAPGG